MNALIYLRVSPRPDESCDSLDTQESVTRRYFEFLKIDVGHVIRDPEQSARLTPIAERPGGRELLALTTGKNPEYTTVGVYRLDRLFRNVVDGITTLEAWTKAGVACHFAAEGGQSINTATATGRFIVNILLSRAAYEPELTAERTSTAMRQHQSNGRLMGGIPYGKRVNSEGTLEDDPAEQATIVVVLRLHSQGMSRREIARHLDDLGVPSRSGKGWDHTTVRRIIKRYDCASTAADSTARR